MPVKVVVCAKGDLEQRSEVVHNAIRVFDCDNCEVEFLWIKTDTVRENFDAVFPDLDRFKRVDKRYLGPLNILGRERRRKEREYLRTKFDIVLSNRELRLMDRGIIELLLEGLSTVWVE